MNRDPHRRTDLSIMDADTRDLEQHNTDDAFAEHLQEALRVLEDMAPDEAPQLAQLTHMVREGKRLEKRRMYRELAFFLLTAVLISSGWVFSLLTRPKVFFSLLGVVSVL